MKYLRAQILEEIRWPLNAVPSFDGARLEVSDIDVLAKQAMHGKQEAGSMLASFGVIELNAETQETLKAA